jgi:glycosyltransferase involved in cell wall biosynthesis
MTERVKRIVHVSESELDPCTGMGRVTTHWKQAFERRNVEFVHFGPERVGPGLHKALWHRAAVKAVRRANLCPDLVLAHEPASYAFVEHGFRTFVFSHMPERRVAEAVSGVIPRPPTVAAWMRRRAMDSLLWSWRQRQCDMGLRHAVMVLVSNRSDATYVRSFYGRRDRDVVVFRNGVTPVFDAPPVRPAARSILFYASWVPRKGIATLVDAIAQLRGEGVPLEVIVCTGLGIQENLASWPPTLRDVVTVVPGIEQSEEARLFEQAPIFVLPSFAEGQPLALLQAMAFGRCCVVSDISGHVDLIQNGKTGFLFPPGDAASLARSLRTCLESPDVCERLGMAAAESVRDRSWAEVSDEVVNWILSRAGSTFHRH